MKINCGKWSVNRTGLSQQNAFFFSPNEKNGQNKEREQITLRLTQQNRIVWAETTRKTHEKLS